MAKTNKTINISYVEGLLILTNAVSVSALHSQHNTMVSQNEVIGKLSGDVSRLNDELVNMKITLQVAGNSVTTPEITKSLLDIPYIDYRIIVGLAGIGLIWYGSTVALAKLSSLTLPSIKSLGAPLKAFASTLPFIATDISAEITKDGITYRVKTEGDKITGLEFRDIGSDTFKPVSEQVQKSLSSTENTVETGSPSDVLAYHKEVLEQNNILTHSDRTTVTDNTTLAGRINESCNSSISCHDSVLSNHTALETSRSSSIDGSISDTVIQGGADLVLHPQASEVLETHNAVLSVLSTLGV